MHMFQSLYSSYDGDILNSFLILIYEVFAVVVQVGSWYIYVRLFEDMIHEVKEGNE